MTSENKSSPLMVDFGNQKFSAVCFASLSENYINEAVLTQINYSKVIRYPYTKNININGQSLRIHSRINVIWKNSIGVHFIRELCVFKSGKNKHDLFLKPEFFDENGQVMKSGVIKLLINSVRDVMHPLEGADAERMAFCTSILTCIEYFLARLSKRIDPKDANFHATIMDIDASCKTMMLPYAPYNSELKSRLYEKVLGAVDLFYQEDNLELCKFARRMLYLEQSYLETSVYQELLLTNQPYKKIAKTPHVAELMAFQVTREMIVEYISRTKTQKNTHADTTKPFKNSTSKIKGKNKLSLSFRNSLLVESIDSFANYILSIQHARFFYDQAGTLFLEKLLKLLDDMVQAGNKVYDHFWNVEEYDFDSCYEFLDSKPVRDDYIIAGVYWVFKSFYTKLARNKFKPASKRECLPGCTVDHNDPNADGTEILKNMMYFYMRLTKPFNGFEKILDTTIIDSIVSDTAMFKKIMEGINNNHYFPINFKNHKVPKVVTDIDQLPKRKALAIQFIKAFKNDVLNFKSISYPSESQEVEGSYINEEIVKNLHDYENDNEAFDALWKNFTHKELWANSKAGWRICLVDLFKVRFAIMRLQIVKIMSGEFNEELFRCLATDAFSYGSRDLITTIRGMVEFNRALSGNISKQKADGVFHHSMLVMMIPESTAYWQVIEDFALEADSSNSFCNLSGMTNKVIEGFIEAFDHPTQTRKKAVEGYQKLYKDVIVAQIPIITFMSETVKMDHLDVFNLLSVYLTLGKLKMVKYDPIRRKLNPESEEIIDVFKAIDHLNTQEMAVLNVYEDVLVMFCARLSGGSFDFDKFLSKVVTEDYFKGFEMIHTLNKTAFLVLHLIIIATNVIYTQSRDVSPSWKDLVDYDRLCELYKDRTSTSTGEPYRFAKGKLGKVILHMDLKSIIDSLSEYYDYTRPTMKSEVTLHQRGWRHCAYLVIVQFLIDLAQSGLYSDKSIPERHIDNAGKVLKKLISTFDAMWRLEGLQENIWGINFLEYTKYTDFWEVHAQLKKATKYLHSVLTIFIELDFENCNNDPTLTLATIEFWKHLFRFIQYTYSAMKFNHDYFSDLWISVFTISKESESIVKIPTEGFPKELAEAIEETDKDESKALDTIFGMIKAFSEIGPEGMEKADFDSMIQKITNEPPTNRGDGYTCVSKNNLMTGFANSIQAMMSGIQTDGHISILEDEEVDKDTYVDESDNLISEKSIDFGTVSRHEAAKNQEAVVIEEVVDEPPKKEAQPIPDMIQEDIDIDDAPTIKENVIEEEAKAAELPVKKELQNPGMVQDDLIVDKSRVEKAQCLEELLKLGEIVPSNSKYASPSAFLPDEEDGEIKLYVDFTNVNKEIPIIDYDRFDSRWSLAGLFKKRYHKSIGILHPHKRLTMDKEEAAKTAFVIDGKKYQFTHRPKGFQNTDYHVFKLMEKAFSGIENIFFSGNLVYLSGDTESEVDEVYAKFNRAIRDNKLKIGASTPTQGVVTVNGHLVSKGGLQFFPESQDFEQMYQGCSKLRSNIAIPQKHLQNIIAFLLYYRNAFLVNPTVLSDLMNVNKGILDFAHIFGSRVGDEVQKIVAFSQTKTDDNDVEMIVSCHFSSDTTCAYVYDNYSKNLFFPGSVYYNKKSIIEDKMSLICQQVLLISRAWKHFTKIVDEAKLKFNGSKYQHLNEDPKKLFSLKERAYIEARCGLDVWKVLKACLDS